MIKEKKSISQLEGWVWNIEIPVEENSSYEEYNFYVLHNKPIKYYSNEDIYFMIGQESGLKYLVPIAIEIISKDFLLIADDYPGDLFSRILRLENNFWQSFPEYYKNLSKMIKKSNIQFPNKELRSEITNLIKSFLSLDV